MTTDAASQADAEPQAVLAPLTGAAIFLVAVTRAEAPAVATVRGLCGDLGALVRAVGTREPSAYLTCVTGIGGGLWDTLAGPERPAGLHPFQEIRAAGRHAVSTPGDLLFHIRAARMDLCYELASQIMFRLGSAVTVVDEVHGFRYFDSRDVIGFVDGTENPVGAAAARATLIGAEDPRFAGGSYVIVQKYLHDLSSWDVLPVEEQERAVGRTKLSDLELPDDVKPANSHVALNTIVDADGVELDIVRYNMPFGRVSDAEFGTYFIGYARDPDVIEQMLRNMFIGDPPGNHDRLLDFSTAVTGNLFFVPTLGLLDGLADPEPAQVVAEATTDASVPPPAINHDGSLGIGDLRGASA